jgi:CheY-like chemotaxis protein
MVDLVAPTGPKVFLAEDSFLNAREVHQAVQELGGTVLGPARSAAEAFDLLAWKRPDLALLDVRLAHGWVNWVIPALQTMRIPFALLTAWDERHLLDGSSLRHVPRLEKPCAVPDLQRLIRRVLGGPATDAHPAQRPRCPSPARPDPIAALRQPARAAMAEA